MLTHLTYSLVFFFFSQATALIKVQISPNSNIWSSCAARKKKKDSEKVILKFMVKVGLELMNHNYLWFLLYQALCTYTG